MPRYRNLNRLAAARVASLRKPDLYPDGGGLYLRVISGTSKSWIFRFRSGGRERWMGLGSLHTWSLAEARERAKHCRQLLDLGKDPIKARDDEFAREKEEAARAVTFQQCAELYIASHGKTWKNAKHAAQWSSTLKTYVYPIIGDLPVASIDTGLVVKVIEPIWHSKPETANRVRGRVESILDWATVRAYRKGENPARWRGHLQKMLPPRSRLAPVKHHPAMPYHQVPAFVADLQGRPGTSPRALEFAILTATRTNEVTGALRPELDLLGKVWTIPGTRMKSGREHRVPLSTRALEIIAALPCEDENGFVFVGARARAPLSNMAMLEMLQGMHPEFTVHGFRSSFRDWAAERTNFAREVAEAALAHIVDDKTEAAYRRGDLFKKRAQLMEAWAKYCARPALATGEDVPLLARAKVVAIGGSA